jgi:predicted anti-sigma-YlaC factor YlaD
MSDAPGGITCARVRVYMEAYVDGDLATEDPVTADRVRLHLADCDDCRRQHDQAISLPFRLRALRAPQPPDSLVVNVMRAVTPRQNESQRAWTLLIPEAALVAFIIWYLSGLDGLAREASSAVNDILGIFNWGAGAASLPAVPVADVFLLGALIALALTAAYHLSVLSHLAEEDKLPPPAWRERRRA